MSMVSLRIRTGVAYSAVYSFPEATLADPLEGWCDAVWPDELVNVEASATRELLLAGDLVLNYEHLGQDKVPFRPGGSTQLQHSPGIYQPL